MKLLPHIGYWYNCAKIMCMTYRYQGRRLILRKCGAEGDRMAKNIIAKGRNENIDSAYMWFYIRILEDLLVDGQLIIYLLLIEKHILSIFTVELLF